jgi:putative ABC transport system permease protein
VDDVRHSGFAADPKPELYTPFAQTPWSAMNVVLHAPSLDVASAASELRETLRSIDPAIGAGQVSSMPSLIAQSVAPERLNVVLLGLLAGLALVLASLGVYAVVNYSVATRTSEMGLRLALGASPGDVLRLVIAEGVRLAAVGAVVGLLGAWAVTRLLSSILFGVSATDPVTFIAVPCLLVLITVVASWLPARRAARVEPITALRNES